MTRLGLLIDVTRCSGCYNCFLACRDEHYGNDYPGYSAAQPLDGQFWMQMKEVEGGKYPRPRLDYIAIPCQHCQNAPCIDAAKDGAVYRREDGIVMIDPEKAKGQDQIVASCPYRVIYWNADLQLPQKCGLCAQRLDTGDKQPRCVGVLPDGRDGVRRPGRPRVRDLAAPRGGRGGGLPSRVRDRTPSAVRRPPGPHGRRRGRARGQRRLRRGRHGHARGRRHLPGDDERGRSATSPSRGCRTRQGVHGHGGRTRATRRRRSPSRRTPTSTSARSC